ncbi:ABC transporter permease [Microbacterium sp. 4R-513]|uniref:ABC transporter permease n=1 Tax=Microbacterium sp. 4R-513 TaxID=2567934 RepID=UPI0013E0FE2B|nr:ABC transporter permease [Microbacterium sp. 4R-513]QIG39494.1 ABC transporter permease [Microbacterium sp. 4R-513]
MLSNRYGFVVRRLASLVPLLLGILLVVMLLLALTPGDPARLVLGPRATQDEVAQAREQLGIDQPLWVRYFAYLAGALHGDLGQSFKTGRSVSAQIFEQLPITLLLAGVAVLMAIVISVPLAVLAARSNGGVADHAVRGFNVLGIGLPPFWLAIMLITYVALPTGWFPVAGFGQTPAENLRSIFLPALVVAIAISPPMIRSLRTTIRGLQTTEYVLAGRTLGFTGFGLTRRFVLRNALPPLITVTAVQASYALFGTVIVEVAFSLPGMGQGLVTAAGARDYPLVQGYTLVFALLIVLVFLLADILTAVIDPRVRISA